MRILDAQKAAQLRLAFRDGTVDLDTLMPEVARRAGIYATTPKIREQDIHVALRRAKKYPGQSFAARPSWWRFDRGAWSLSFAIQDLPQFHEGTASVKIYGIISEGTYAPAVLLHLHMGLVAAGSSVDESLRSLQNTTVTSRGEYMAGLAVIPGSRQRMGV